MDSHSDQNDENHATKNAENETIIEFRHFDVVPEASDHHYLQKKQFNPDSSVYTNIMKEWKILEKNLPDSIYVQVYETRIDLLRAVIIGPHGTPYENGLFFFDILLPYDYPKQPPKVHYRSHGYRLNPNLYANGYVCLSLINTWTGKKSEKWSQNSTILQILVSIQGLVLNEKPFFNEPGFRNARNSSSNFWIRKSLKYNENVLILSCKTMLHIIRKRPEGFEVFVDRYFRDRGDVVLATVKRYQKGYVPVGRNFKAQLVSIYSDLEKAMNRKPEMEEIENKKKNEKYSSNIVKNQGEVKNQKKKGIFKRLIKWIWK